MSIARHHAEWLSLVEVSGPFLSMPVLLRSFPQGLDKTDPQIARNLRLAYEEWVDNQGGLRPDPAIHWAWVRFVLRDVLQFPDEVLVQGPAIPEPLKASVAEHGETLRPDLVVQEDNASPRLLVQVVPPAQDLEKPLAGQRWKASPATRMVELLHATDVRLGLLTNGEQWMLVHAPRGETTGFASWYAALWQEEPITLQAFQSLLGVYRFFGVAEPDTLQVLLAESAQNQQDVTDQLGYQVRQAVEVLVQAIDRADKDRNRVLLQGMSEAELYQAALTVMMRLVFLFSAEERGLLLLSDPLYDQHYAVSTLNAQLHAHADQYGEEVLERRYDAWTRLLATFRAVHGGVEHDALRLPAYGGHLFDPDRFPFLEGRTPGTHWHETLAKPIQVNNRTVLHLLEALQFLKVKVQGGGSAERRRLSFRALDIEQIGHVYEGLLDHTAVRASEPMLGLQGSKDREPEMPLAELEALYAKGKDALVKALQERTGRSVSALSKGINVPLDVWTRDQLRVACDNDEALFERVKPFWGVLRRDSFSYPVVISDGSVYVTTGTDRRTSGTHYTPRILTEPIVQHTLDPLVYIGPAEGLPKEQWQLRSAAEILDLKVCDMAMGSGAFLVQACRYLSERLVEAWEVTETAHPGCTVITPEGALSTGAPDEQPLPRDADERLALARRLVADRCLYGVDKNPLAVEMGKLSLWLITLQKDRPFTFLDHALRCGDSLLGVDVDQLKHWSLEREGPVQLTWFTRQIEEALDTALALRKRIAATPVRDVRDADTKARLLREAEEAMDVVRLGADLLVATALLPAQQRETARDDFLARFSITVESYQQRRDGRFTEQGVQPGREALQQLRSEADMLLGTYRPFHWPLEFPEAFVDTELLGFSAFVGNPPFVGGRRVRESLGDLYRDMLYVLYPNSSGNADISAFFFLRAFDHLRRSGTFGLIATNTIAQGDTRQTGLDFIVAQGGIIYNALNNQTWPGQAAVTVNIVHIAKQQIQPPFMLDNKPVHHISSFLNSRAVTGEPYLLSSNEGKSHMGTNVVGVGFTVTCEEAHELIRRSQQNARVLFPYLNGEDLNSSPTQAPSRWIINFFDWPLEEAERYPDCMAIVRARVYPDRVLSSGSYARLWWQYGRRQERLYEAIESVDRVLAVAQTTKYMSFAFVPKGYVYAMMTIIFALDKGHHFAVLSSAFHDAWAWQYSSTMRNAGLRYAPTDCFQNFPFPQNTPQIINLDRLGNYYHNIRHQIMLDRHEGLTKTYNRFHNQSETADDIVRLRALHVEMDAAVAAAYGWTDLDLEHGFHTTKQGVRFTVSEQARREILDRLLLLNHERYAEEVAQGLHDKGAKKNGKGKRKQAVSAEQGALL